MGANAQTSVPAFTAGQVLTAQQQTEINTGIPVFATTTTRDAAFGGTGEKVLAEGQFAYIEASDTTQYYDGSTWQTVGASGLTLISTTTIGSAVANVTVSNAFSSTYDNYRIIVNSGVGSADSHLRMTLGATATGYYFAGVSANYAGGSAGVGAAQNAAFWEAGYNTTNSLFLAIDVLSPNLAKNTMFSTVRCNATTGGATVATGGYLADTTQYTAFTLTPASGTLTGGTIRVYGYRNS